MQVIAESWEQFTVVAGNKKSESVTVDNAPRQFEMLSIYRVLAMPACSSTKTKSTAIKHQRNGRLSSRSGTMLVPRNRTDYIY